MKQNDDFFDTLTPPLLKQGDEGSEVAKLQEYLIELGFLRGEPNGIFGPTTKRAVELFQRTLDLPINGIIDEVTWNTLIKTLDSKFPSSMPTLKLGDTGVEVKSLQHRLIVLGFLETAAKGIFDEATQQAVIAFQIFRSLAPDGIVGPRTWSQINQMFAATAINIPTIKPVIQERDRGDYVLLLQNMLTAFGYFFGNVDGIFGRNTTNAVIKFQQTYGLNPTGIVDYYTWDVLDSLLSPTWRNLPILEEGSTAPEVRLLQDKLNVAGFFPGAITGSFGPETTKAIKKFQSANNLNVNGISDRETWEKLFTLTAIVTEEFLGEGYTTPVGSRPTLRYGDNNPYVAELQRDLTVLGFYNGTIDGVFGAGTQSAVKAFQTNNKLTADGIVGRHTWSALIYLYSPLAICGDITLPPTPPTSDFIGIVIDPGHGGYAYTQLD